MKDGNFKVKGKVTESKTGTNLVHSKTPQANLFKKHKLSITMGLLLGAMSAFTLSSAPLFADSINSSSSSSCCWWRVT